MFEKTLYLNGEFILEKEAKIPFSDRGFLFGDGVYTTIQVKEGIPVFLPLHLKRLQDNCEQFKILFPQDISLSQVIQQVIEKNKAFEGIWKMKVVITGGSSTTPGLPSRKAGLLLVFFEPFTPTLEIPLLLEVFPFPYASCHAKYKCLAHLNRHFVSEFAKTKGVDDAVTLTETGTILETSFGNLLFCNEELETVWVPSPQLPLHYGITMTVIEQALRNLGVKVEFVSWKLSEIPVDILAFRVNTMSQVRQIVRIGKRGFELNEKPFQYLKGLLESSKEVSIQLRN